MTNFIKNIALAVLISFSTIATGQLPDGSIAPDFTTTDVNGNVHRLYDYLDDGYTVILDISATWCGPCWNYHTGGTFEEIWEDHGPAGEPGVSPNTTDDVVILWFEGDPNTAESELENSDYGNWLNPEGAGEIQFPMINDNNIADLYDLPYWPVIYTICPNRILSESGQLNAAGHYAGLANCMEASQGINAALINIESSIESNGCEASASGNLSVTVQNMGTEVLSTFTVEVIAGGESIASETFNGYLEVFDVTTIDFGNLTIDIPNDFSKTNYEEVENFFDKLKNEEYSINRIEDIVEKIETITINEQYESIKATVNEQIVDNKININFKIEEIEKFFIERINILGNNITRESVIRNQIEIDEGDPFNEILYLKSLNNIKALNFFEDVNGEILEGNEFNTKIININITEKATGEIFAGVGTGTEGSSFSFGVKENNYLGRGINVDSNLNVSEEKIKGKFIVSNPNYKNSDKRIDLGLEASSVDRLGTSGYKSNVSGFTIGTQFEYLDDFRLGLSSKNNIEKIEVDGSASAKQKKQDGNYFDSFIGLDFIYDKRNQRYQTTSGFLSDYNLNLPILSDTNTLTNVYNYKVFKELYENNVSSFSFLFKAASSLSGDDIKLSERMYIPGRKLRGFETGKIGPKDGSDFIGGNYVSTINATTSLPKILENVQNVDVVMFADAANIWGVDYDSSLDKGGIRSSVGVGLDWLTPVGPLTFSFAKPITKESTDIEETFRFNIGTSF